MVVFFWLFVCGVFWCKVLRRYAAVCDVLFLVVMLLLKGEVDGSAGRQIIGSASVGDL